MADRVHRAFLGRAGDQWLHAIVVAGRNVVDRDREATSGAVPVGSLVNVADRYVFSTSPA